MTVLLLSSFLPEAKLAKERFFPKLLAGTVYDFSVANSAGPRLEVLGPSDCLVTRVNNVG